MYILSYSAAVCELSEACEMLLERGFNSVVFDVCESAILVGSGEVQIVHGEMVKM
jgi:hypothetical protein